MASEEIVRVRELLFAAKEGMKHIEDINVARAGYEAIGAGYQIEVPVKYEDDALDSVPVRIFKPGSPRGDLLYLHGGGYCIGSRSTHSELCARIAHYCSVTVYLIDYRLAPENPFPAAVVDAWSSYRALLNSSGPPFVAGDSAGGGLSLALTRLALDANVEPPRKVVVFSPWADLTLASRTLDELAEIDPIVSRESLTEMAQMYLDQRSPSVLAEHSLPGADFSEDIRRHPYVSPALGSFRGFPDLLVQVGSDEVLIGDARAVAECAQADGAAATLSVYPECFHVFQQIAARSPEADQALKEMAAFLSDE